MTGATDDGREDGSGRIVSGESSLAHAGAVVNYEGSNFIITHFVEILCVLYDVEK
jgi:hypothetical protein